jgi:hypothetical protein
VVRSGAGQDEEAVKTKLILDSIDPWLLTQPTLINKRTRSVLPAMRDRQAPVDEHTRTATARATARGRQSGDHFRGDAMASDEIATRRSSQLTVVLECN